VSTAARRIDSAVRRGPSGGMREEYVADPQGGRVRAKHVGTLDREQIGNRN